MSYFSLHQDDKERKQKGTMMDDGKGKEEGERSYKRKKLIRRRLKLKKIPIRKNAGGDLDYQCNF